MPAHSPFTQLCQAAVAPLRTDRADLHVHSTASDGRYTPAQVIEIARRTGLAAIALTDHDTVAGIEPAQATAGHRLEVIPAVELSCEYAGREVHLLAYFVRPEDPALRQSLDRMREHRAGRYAEMVAKLRRLGVAVPETPPNGSCLGRRHLAEALVKDGTVGSVREAFQRYLDDDGPAHVPKLRFDFSAAIALVGTAGGVASYAHPPPHVDRQTLCKLATLGLQAVEAEYPGFRAARTAELRRWATELRLAVTGGSDCHGPDGPRRSIGAKTISIHELDKLRALTRG
jgi:predicted metal-dependent phosphoesterase TrpH